MKKRTFILTKSPVMKKSSLRFICASVLMALGTTADAQGVINTIAGTGISGYGGDGGPANVAQLSSPSGVATDAAGNIYIADKNNHRVRKIDAATGEISTFAGNGTYGFSGMGGDAALASIKYPSALYFDNGGNLFVNDNFNDIVFKIDAGSHAIHNHCGDGHQGSSGDGGHGHHARTCVPDGVGGDNAGNIYVMDIGNHKIRKVNSDNIVSTFTGTYTGPYANPAPLASTSWGTMNGICSDNMGNLYVSDAGNHIVRKIDMATGMVRTVAGTAGMAGYYGDGGNATNALLNSPKALYLNDEGYLFICDPNTNVVRVLNTANGIINTLAGTGAMGYSGDGGAPTSARLNRPTGVWQDAGTGKIYIADAGNQRVRVITGSAYRNITMGNTTTASSSSVFPNPATGVFTVETGGAATMEIFNIAGQLVYTQSTTDSKAVVELKQPSGTYTVKVSTANGTESHKVTLVK